MPAHLQLQLCITSSGAYLYYRVSVSQLCVSVSSVPVCGAFLMATCKSASVRFINLSPPMGNILITIYHILYVYIYSYILYVCVCELGNIQMLCELIAIDLAFMWPSGQVFAIAADAPPSCWPALRPAPRSAPSSAPLPLLLLVCCGFCSSNLLN